MRYEVRIGAYDVLDTIWFSAMVTETESFNKGPAITVVHIADQIAGQGESDPREWLRDVLLAILEDI